MLIIFIKTLCIHQVQFERIGCGGTIIDPWHVVTAGHCIPGMEGQTVVAGASYRKSREVTNSTEECTIQRRRVKYVQPHPCYCDEYVSSWFWQDVLLE